MNRYGWNRSLIEPFTFMSLKGIRYDSEQAAAMRQEQLAPMWSAQARVDELAGVALPDSTAGLLEVASQACCHKVRLKKALKGWRERVPALDSEGRQLTNAKGKPLKEWRVIVSRPLSWDLCLSTANSGRASTLEFLRQLVEQEQTPAIKAEIAALLGTGVNVESPDQVIETLDRLGLPAKWKRGKHNPDDPDAGRTGDEEALLDLFMRTSHPITKAILEARGARGAISWLDSMLVDPDGRVRCSFANPGSETGRVLTRTWHSGSGGNLQAVSQEPINFRRLLRADPGHLMAQCDLKGADGWTVAARTAQHGDRTMIEDLKAGIRIPSLLSLLMDGSALAPSREALRAQCKAVAKDWRDYAFKKAQHLSNYMGSAGLIQRETVRESWSATGTPIDPGLAFCQRVQSLYLARYWGLKSWWADVERQVRRDGTLTGASGQTREFLSRRWAGEGASKRLDHSTHKEAIATEPQMVTTYTTNLALWRLWCDPQNWPSGVPGGTRPGEEPYVQPLLHGHDAINVQFRAEHLRAAGTKLNEWFSNPIRIGSIVVNIPVEMAYGPSWGECKTAFPQ